MKDLQRELEEAKADVEKCMKRVRKASLPREMMARARELTEAKFYLEALERLVDDDDLQRTLEKLKTNVSASMICVRTSTTAREMISCLYDLIEDQIRLETLESLLDDGKEEG